MRLVQHRVVNRGPDLCPALAEHPGAGPMAHRAAVLWGVGEGWVRPGHSDQASRLGIRTRHPDEGLRYRQFGGWGGVFRCKN